MRKYLLLGWVVLLFALQPGQAGAHANLVESNPAANSVLAEAPATARLRFSEPLEASYSRVVLNSAEGGVVGTEPSRVNPNDPYVLLLDLPVLSEGVYALQWRTLSTVDGHTLQGVVSFAIGDPAAASAPLLLPPPPPDPLAMPQPLDVALRWLVALSLTLAVGSLFFSLAVWRPDLIANTAVYAKGIQLIRWLALGATVLASVATLVALIRASAVAERPLVATMTSSRIGLVLVARLCLAVLLAGVVWAAWSYHALLGLPLGIAALLTISLLSHSAVPQISSSGSLFVLATVSALVFDLIHLAATAAWIGSLPALMAVLLVLHKQGERGTRELITQLVARYSGLATAAIIALAATGTVTALRHVGSITELWTTTYGRALSIKLLVFGVLLLLGGYNRWWLNTETKTSSVLSTTGLRQLRINVGLEVAVSVLLLLAVGVLTASAPARDAAPTAGAFAQTVPIATGTLSLQVIRDQLAGDIFAVSVQGLPPNVEPTAVIRVSMPTHQMGEQELELQQVEPGRWGARAPLLTMPGAWNIETIVRAIGMNDLRHTFVMDTTPATQQTADTSPFPLWALLLVLALLAVAAGTLPVQSMWQHRFQVSGIVLLLGAFVVAIGTTYFGQPSVLSNPLSATPEVLAAGEIVYQRNCVSCHGVGGQGDGPAAQSLPGLPADFTQPHFATHTDSELYEWIKGGKPGTAMPAFGDTLSEEEIWQAITYIRQIYTDAQQAAR